ncbi:MAG TPA: hypothetical protein VLT84_02700, partial [Acidobacteriota bacterium]|nr:hypothetical protein [Acidobacteriota bacterium]
VQYRAERGERRLCRDRTAGARGCAERWARKAAEQVGARQNRSSGLRLLAVGAGAYRQTARQGCAGASFYDCGFPQIRRDKATRRRESDLSTVRNLGHTASRFTAASFDQIRHYRPEKNVLERPTLAGGKGHAFVGPHELWIPLLAALYLGRAPRVAP